MNILSKKFADDSGHTAAELNTNRTLVHLMTLVFYHSRESPSTIRPVDQVVMTFSAVAELQRQGKEYRTLKLYGQERNPTTSAIARMNLFLHGIEDFHIDEPGL